MERFLGRMLIRFAVRKLGIIGTLLALALSLVAVGGVFGLFTMGCVGCFGGVLGLVGLDIATATPEPATVSGHRWEREIRPEEAERGPDGKIRWTAGHPVELSGHDLEPVWPVVPDDDCTRVGCRRPGTRREKYELELRMADGRAETCTVPEGDWPLFATGSALTVEVGGMLGTIYCQGAEPGTAPAPPPPKGGRRGRR